MEKRKLHIEMAPDISEGFFSGLQYRSMNTCEKIPRPQRDHQKGSGISIIRKHTGQILGHDSTNWSEKTYRIEIPMNFEIKLRGY